jgi:hypothetical protein
MPLEEPTQVSAGDAKPVSKVIDIALIKRAFGN